MVTLCGGFVKGTSPFSSLPYDGYGPSVVPPGRFGVYTWRWWIFLL